MDGLLGVEWIFRNELIDKREREIYVDYIEMDNKDIWTSPKDYEDIDLKPWELRSDITYLIIFMQKCGFTKYEVLNLYTSVTQKYKDIGYLNEYLFKDIVHPYQ